MARMHLKRLAAPLTWPIRRKENRFVARPKGSFSLGMGMPLITALKDVLNLVRTRKEGKLVLNAREILVNGKRRKDEKFMVGLMDVLTIKDLNRSYRVLLDTKGSLRLVPLSDGEAAVKPCRVIGKRTVKGGKVQLSLHDGRSLLGAGELGEHKAGDTIVLELPSNKIAQHIKLEDGCQAYLTGGNHVGCTGVVEHVLGDKRDKVIIRIGDEVVESAKRFVFAIGKGKPVIKSVISNGE